MLGYKRVTVIVYSIIFIFTSVEVTCQYEGHLFPSKYLGLESIVPTELDLKHYLQNLKRTIEYFEKNPNSTDSNTALSLYFTKCTLKRTLLDYRKKLQVGFLEDIARAINDVEYILSHYIYNNNKWYDWSFVIYRVSKLFQYDASLTYATGKFSKNRFDKWIYNKENVNDFVEEIDRATLPKEQFAALIESGRQDYYINIADSDECISRVAFNPEPINVTKVRPCISDAYCNYHLSTNPSMGYTLSHRLLNMLFRLSVRRCYVESEERDVARVDQLCAFMYREAVYIARRGFFARDLFLEHIALCATMGYEEFHRRQWFRKAISWMNDAGCVKEFWNFDLNRTRMYLEEADAEGRRYLMTWRCNTKYSVCDDHPSALLMIVLSHAVRHAAHFISIP